MDTSERKRKLDASQNTDVPSPERTTVVPAARKMQRRSVNTEIAQDSWGYKIRLRAYMEHETEDSTRGRYWCEAFIAFRTGSQTKSGVGLARPTTTIPGPLAPVPGSEYSAYIPCPVHFALNIDARRMVEILSSEAKTLEVSFDKSSRVVLVSRRTEQK
jgi:hypothetical protein